MGLTCHRPYSRGVMVCTLGWNIVLSLVGFFDFLVDAFDKPLLVGNRIVVVRIPVHPEVVSKKKEGF